MSRSADALRHALLTYNKAGIIKESLITKKKAAIIKEAKEAKLKKEQIDNLSSDIPEDIQDTAQEVSNKVQLDDVEKDFIDKFIEYSELTLLNKSNTQLIKTFEKSLGANATAAIEQLDKKTKERKERIDALIKQLSDIKDQIVKETEKAKAKETLVSLYDSAKDLTAPEKTEATPKRKQNLNPSQLNIVETKKR